MPVTTTRTAFAPHDYVRPSQATCETALRMFRALGALHRLPDDDADLLRRAAAGLRFIRSTSSFSPADDSLFRIALADLSDRDAFVVETAARYAADLAPSATGAIAARAGRTGERTALWLAAILRLADAVTAEHACVCDVYAIWTDSALFLEFDATDSAPTHLACAAQRVSALEALTGRSVVLAESTARRGAA